MKSLKRFTKRKLSFALVSLSFIAIMGIYMWSLSNKTNIAIHFISRYSVDSTGEPYASKYSEFNEIILRQYLKEIEDENSQIKFDLITHDNFSNPAISEKIYQNIANNVNGPYLVVDNTWGVDMGQCTDIIASRKIPVISLNANHNDKQYGPGSIFIGNDDEVPYALSNFIAKVLKVNEIFFITEDDSLINRKYLQRFDNLGINISKRIELTTTHLNITPEDSIIFEEKFLSQYSPGQLLVLNTHNNWGSLVIKILNKKIKNARVIAPQSSVSVLTEGLSAKNDNEYIMITPSQDAISLKVKKDLEHFKSTYTNGLFERKNIHSFINRFLFVKDFLQRSIQYSDNLNRDSFYQFIENETSPNLIGKNDVYYFRKHQNDFFELEQDYNFSSFKKGTLSSYPIQLSKDYQPIPNLFFGMELKSIYNINLENGYFNIDFYYWIKVDSNFVQVEKYIDFPRIKIESVTELISKPIENTSFIYRLFKVSGVSNNSFDLSSFPRDEHTLKISSTIIDPQSNIKLSFDELSLNSSLEELIDLGIENWSPVKYYVTVDNQISSSSKGLLEKDITSRYKIISFWLTIKRNSPLSIISPLLPLFLIAWLSLLTFFINDKKHFFRTGDYLTGLLLSVILYSISLLDITPSSEQIKISDKIYWTTLFTVLLSLFSLYDLDYWDFKFMGLSIRKWFGLTTGLLYSCYVIILLFV